MTAANDLVVRRALEAAGVEFIDENGGGAGVRLRNRQGPKQAKWSPRRSLCFALQSQTRTRGRRQMPR